MEKEVKPSESPDWNSRNRFLRNAFGMACCAGTGIAFAAQSIRTGLGYDLGALTDFVRSNDLITYFRDHVIGTGQIVMCAEWANLMLSGAFRGVPSSKPLKDHSLSLGTAFMAAVYVSENYDMHRYHNTSLDSADLICYAIGVAAFIGWNKLAVLIADNRYASKTMTANSPVSQTYPSNTI